MNPEKEPVKDEETPENNWERQDVLKLGEDNVGGAGNYNFHCPPHTGVGTGNGTKVGDKEGSKVGGG